MVDIQVRNERTNVRFWVRMQGSDTMAALHKAAAEADGSSTDTIKLLLEGKLLPRSDDIRIDETDLLTVPEIVLALTALAKAAAAKKELSFKGISPHSCDDDMRRAVLGNDYRTVLLLVEARVSVKTLKNGLATAVKERDYAVATLLLRNCKFLLDGSGDTPCPAKLAVETEATDFFGLLIEHGADPSWMLRVALDNKSRPTAAASLLNNDYNLQVSQEDLRKAFENDLWVIVQLLVPRVVSPDQGVLQSAILKGDVRAVRFFVDHGAPVAGMRQVASHCWRFKKPVLIKMQSILGAKDQGPTGASSTAACAGGCCCS